MTNIEERLARLNPKTAAMFRKASTVKRDFLPTPSLGINMSIGGLGYNQIHTIWGNRSSGKSNFCLGLVKNAQAKDQGCAWIDAEKNFDPAWATRNGVDPDEMAISQIASIADMADAAVDLIRSGMELIVVDSMSVLLPQSYFVDGDMKQLADTGQIGTFAKNYTAALNMINNQNEKTCVVMISQVRNKISTYGASKTLMGGEGAEFMNSTIIKLWSPPNAKEDITGKVAHGDLILDRPIGRPVTWTIDKARGSGMHHTNSYDLYYAGDHVGIDLVGEIVDFGVEFGVIKKGGAWYNIGDEKFQGRPKIIAHLRENEGLQQELYSEILQKVAA